MTAHEPPSPTDAESRRQRETARRAMLRANTAIGIILAAMLTLALLAVGATVRSLDLRRRAERSEAEQEQQLWNAYREQARATRLSQEAGARRQALVAVGRAASIRASGELRNEAIACLSLLDLDEESPALPALDGDVRYRDIHPDFGWQARTYRSGRTELLPIADGGVTGVLDPEMAGVGTNRIVSWMRIGGGGGHLAVGYLDSTVVLWRLADRRPLLVRTNPGPGYLVPPSFGTDGRWFAFHDAAREGGGLALYELASGRLVRVPEATNYFACAVAPGRPVVAYGAGSEVRVWDFERGERLGTLVHPAEVGNLEWSHDGRRLASACTRGEVFLWEPESETFRALTGHSAFVGNLAFSPDDRRLISSSMDGTTRLWDCEQGQPIVRTGMGQALRFDREGRRIGYTREGYGIGRWRVVEPSSVRTFEVRGGGNEPNRPFDLSVSGRWLAALAPRGLQWWDLDRQYAEGFEPFGPAAHRQRMISWSVTFHPDERRLLLCYGGRLEEWTMQLPAPGERPTIGGKRPIPLPAGAVPRQATLGLDGRTVLVELLNRELVVVDLESGRPPVTLEGRGVIYYPSLPGSPTGAGRFVVSPDGRYVAVGKDVGPNRGPSVWDARSGRLVASLEAGGMTAFRPDGKVLAGLAPGRHTLFGTEDWRPWSTLELPELGSYAGYRAWTRDGRWSAYSSSRRAIEWFGPEAEEAVARFTLPDRHAGGMFRLALDGSRLAMVTTRDLLWVWDLTELRRELSAWALDWPDPGDPTPAVPANVSGVDPAERRTAGSVDPLDRWTPATVALVGLTLVAAAAVVAVQVLRRHRSLIHRWIQGEAVAQQRRRELEAARIELMHSQKMRALGTLAAGIAHDFNNLLSVIRMSNQFVGRATRGDAELREHVEDIEQAVNQGKTVVRSMLGYARDGSGEAGPQDVNSVIEETVSLLSKEFLHGIRLELELERDLPAVRLGRGRLEQVLLNIIVNAAEALRGRGHLRIAANLRPRPEPGEYVLPPRSSSACVDVVVADSGPGIPPEIRSRIFEPFFTTKTESARQGAGLGLSMVYTVAEQEGLGLALRSEPGRGTTFRVVVPVADPGSDVRSEPESAPVRRTHSASDPSPN